ncbi:hypothetical protein ACEQ8H_006138 [Pleosporales sp. CAS-2024a]
MRFDQGSWDDRGPHEDADGNSQQSNSASVQNAGVGEISGVNRHTDGIEFYGSSSSFALLSRVQCLGQEPRDNENTAGLVSSLHNPTFQTTQSECHEAGSVAGTTQPDYYPQCRRFIEDFFTSIHYIHPILNKQDFLQKCEGLRSSGRDENGTHQLSSFIALYYSVLSVGAIVGIRDEDYIDGLSNLQWSRKFFSLALARVQQIGLITNLEIVQCFFMMVSNETGLPSVEVFH